MKSSLRILILLLLVQYLLPRCANPGRPSGGPKDTIPPTLISSTPTLGTTNYKEQILSLEFSEYINADKIRQQLIITPRTDIEYKSIVKRNRLIIKLSEPLQDSTTYNFNFAAGVTDITEKNPALNLSLAFSTGSTIDSLSLDGKIEDLLTQEPAKKYLVGLYPISDSLDFFTDKPLYFTATNDSGSFELRYIKAGNYKVLSYDDANNNQTLDPQEEKHAFLQGSLQLDSPTTLTRPLAAILQNVKPIEIIGVRPTGLYVEAKANKAINSYQVQPDNFYHQLVGEDSDVIRIYKPDSISYSDSLTFIITARDSLGNIDYDTTKTVFLQSNRKTKPLTVNKIQNQITWADTLNFSLSFDKPILHQLHDSVQLRIDSSANHTATFITKWNKNRTLANLQLTIEKDSVLTILAQQLPPDTVKADSISPPELQPISQERLISEIPIELFIPAKAFLSVESDTTASILWPIRPKTKTKGGTLNIQLDTNHPEFTFQLMEGSEPKYSIKNQEQFQLANVPPGKYSIRILIDSNKDGKWSFGNLLLDLAPEEIYLHPQEISVRENWVNEFTISF